MTMSRAQALQRQQAEELQAATRQFFEAWNKLYACDMSAYRKTPMDGPRMIKTLIRRYGGNKHSDKVASDIDDFSGSEYLKVVDNIERKSVPAAAWDLD